MASGSESAGSRLDTIVLLGSFNPAILSPEWLRQNDVITQYDVDHAIERERLLVHPDIAAAEFRTFSLQVDRMRQRSTSGHIIGAPSSRQRLHGVVGRRVREATRNGIWRATGIVGHLRRRGQIGSVGRVRNRHRLCRRDLAAPRTFAAFIDWLSRKRAVAFEAGEAEGHQRSQWCRRTVRD